MPQDADLSALGNTVGGDRHVAAKNAALTITAIQELWPSPTPFASAPRAPQTTTYIWQLSNWRPGGG